MENRYRLHVVLHDGIEVRVNAGFECTESPLSQEQALELIREALADSLKVREVSRVLLP